MASILLDLQLGSTHSSLSTIFFVVLAWEQSISMNKMSTSKQIAVLRESLLPVLLKIQQLVLKV